MSVEQLSLLQPSPRLVLPSTNTRTLELDHPYMQRGSAGNGVLESARLACRHGLMTRIRSFSHEMFKSYRSFSESAIRAQGRLQKFSQALCQGCSFEGACPYQQPTGTMPPMAVGIYLSGMKSQEYVGEPTPQAIQAASKFHLSRARRSLAA